MKLFNSQKSGRLAVAAVMCLSLASCSGSKYADSKQVKSFIFMECIDDDYKESLAKDYYQLLENNKVKDVVIPHGTVEMEIGQDVADGSPWLKLCENFFCSRIWWYNPIRWDLDEDVVLSKFNSDWNKFALTLTSPPYYYSRMDKALDCRISEIDSIISGVYQDRVDYAENGDENEVDECNALINMLKSVKVARENTTDFDVLGLLVANSYINYIHKIADEKVEVYYHEFSNNLYK